MPDIPEHLLQRSAERRKALGLPARGEEGAEATAEGAPDEPAAPAPAAEATAPEGTASETTESETGAPVTAASDAGEGGGESKGGVPAHLLERAQRRRAQLAGGGGDGGGAAAPAAAGAASGGGAATATKVLAPPTATGPGGHTQRLLTVVKSGSIQQTKAEAQDKVHTWPHLLVTEFAATLAMSAMVLVFSALVRAPLLAGADVNQTPNPSKAPWYFLGLQELLTMFHPMVAGVTIPGMGIFVLMTVPYIDRNASHRPSDRKFAIALFTIFLMFWAVLVIIGSFFRGRGFNFVFPWKDGIFFEL